MAVRDAPAEAQELLRQRGLLLLQGLQLGDPEGGEDEEEGGEMVAATVAGGGKPSNMLGQGLDWMASVISAAAEASECYPGGLGSGRAGARSFSLVF
jgi:hypothetical protein